MKKLIIIFIFFPIYCYSQLNDSFDDGNFTQNPIWIGNDSSFIVENYQLRSNGPQAALNTIYLSTENYYLVNTEWNFLVDLKFNPTSTTFVRVYLVSDQADLSQSNEAYYIEIGQTNQDYIKFYKKLNNVSSLLFTGSTAFANNVKARIKVTRDNNGKWNIYCDNNGGYSFNSEGNPFTDNSIINTSYFGFYCQYNTASRYNLYYFDDVKIGDIVIDTVAPYVISLNAPAANKLDILFSEEIDPLSVTDVNNFLVNNAINNPVSANCDLINKSLLHLTFSQNFNQNTAYEIEISNISDLNANVMSVCSKTFFYHIPQIYDIVINEIMTDENPAPLVLPAVDYIELFNRTKYTINLNGWKIKLKDDAPFLNIGSIVLLPDSFLILAASADLASLKPYCSNVFGFSSFAVNNETSITLADASGNIIHNVNFTKAWYNDVTKQEGGWSLEQIDPDNPCGDNTNWRASVNPNGGSPGKANSVKASNPDNKSPYISKICVLNKYSIKVFFNEKMNALGLQNMASYHINNNLQIVNLNLPPNEMNSVVLILNDSIQNQMVYNLSITDSLTDCVGNLLPFSSSEKFAYPIVSKFNDVIINEILFNPKDDGVDFVEIYNRSKINIDLNKLYIATYDFNNNKLKSMYQISADCGTLFSGDYLALTTNPEKVKQQYISMSPKNFIKMASMPAYNNDMGIVVLCLSDSSIIDRFDYNENMHLPLLTTVDGVSLERISSEKATQEKQNWHSASQTVGFATPAYKNSQYSDFLYLEEPISIYPEIFSPDNDGYHDIVSINYQFSEQGYIANISVFDSKGKLVKILVKNELLGTKGSYIWDGITESGQKAIIGIYIIYFEVFDMMGNSKSYKKTVVLGGKF